MVTIDMRNDATLMESRRKSRLGVAKEPDCLGAFNGNDAIWFVLVDMDFILHRHQRYRWDVSGIVYRDDTTTKYCGRGLANAIAGSGLLILWATVIGTPLGIMAGIYLAEYGRKSWLAEVTRFINDILLSAPSIVVGLFVYTIVVAKMEHFSGWAGVIALALLQVPIVIRTTENMLKLVPDSLREAAYALGTPKWRMISAITLKASVSGILTGILLAIARIAGETAPLLFTSLSNQFWSTDLTRPIANLPVTIFKFAMSPFAEWQNLAWAGCY